MDIYYITPTKLPSNKANAVHVICMSMALVNLDHKVNLFIQSNCKSLKKYLNSNYGEMSKFINVISCGAISSKGTELFITIKAIIYYVKNINHSKSLKILSRNLYAAFIFGVIFGKKIVYETHIVESGFIRRALQRQLLRNRRVETVVISSALKEIMLDEYISSPSKIHVMHDAAFDDGPVFNISMIKKMRKEYYSTISECTNYKYYAGYYGQLYPGRGIDIIEGIAKLNNSVLFLIYGGDDNTVLTKRRNNSCKNIVYMGYLPSKNIKSTMALMNVLLLPYQSSVSVGVKNIDTAKWMSPIKMFEYMSVNIPIISSDLPVIREILRDKHNSILVQPDDILSWSLALDEVLNNKILSDKISKNAYIEFKNNYTWEIRAERILSTLN